MARIKRGTISRRRHKALLEKTKGFRMTRARLIGVAQEAVLHAGQYAYHGRKRRKRDMRRLWILRIGQAVQPLGMSYNAFIHGLKAKKIDLDRKILADLVVRKPEVFKQVVEQVKG